MATFTITNYPSSSGILDNLPIGAMLAWNSATLVSAQTNVVLLDLPPGGFVNPTASTVRLALTGSITVTTFAGLVTGLSGAVTQVVASIGGTTIQTLSDPTGIGISFAGGRAVANETQSAVFNGADTINGGAQRDFLTGGDGADSINGGFGGDSLVGNAGNDSIYGGAGDDTMTGGAGDDNYYFWLGGVDVVVESANEGTDRIHGYTDTVPIYIPGLPQYLSNTTLYTLATNVENYTGGGEITGNESHNHMVAPQGMTGVKFSALAGNDTLEGDNWHDTLLGGDGDDFLLGYGGDDVLDGGAGADSMAGDNGDDAYIVDNVGDVVEEYSVQFSALSGVDTVKTTLATYSLALNVEKLEGLSSTGQNLSGNSLANVITALEGADSLFGGAGSDLIYGGAGNDTIVGSGVGAGAGDLDIAFGGDGDDRVLLSGDGSLYAEGGAGNDSMVGGGKLSPAGSSAIQDYFFGQDGDDTLWGNAGSDYFDGGAGDDSIVGGRTGGSIDDSQFDLMFGGAGNDFLEQGTSGKLYGDGGAGNDTVFGGDLAGASPDVVEYIFGGDGNDNLSGGGGNDALVGSHFDSAGDAAQVDTISGGAGDDFVLQGSWGRGNLSGGAGKDTIVGAAGDDVLHLGAGDDYAYGLRGADTFNVANVDLNAGGQDVIIDLFGSEGDVLRFEGVQAAAVSFFDVAGFGAMASVAVDGGSHTILAQHITAAQMQAATTFL